jgi:hypothetical protein
MDGIKECMAQKPRQQYAKYEKDYQWKMENQLLQITRELAQLRNTIKQTGKTPTVKEKGFLDSVVGKFLSSTVLPAIGKYGPKFLTPIADMALSGLGKLLDWISGDGEVGENVEEEIENVEQELEIEIGPEDEWAALGLY